MGSRMCDIQIKKKVNKRRGTTLTSVLRSDSVMMLHAFVWFLKEKPI